MPGDAAVLQVRDHVGGAIEPHAAVSQVRRERGLHRRRSASALIVEIEIALLALIIEAFGREVGDGLDAAGELHVSAVLDRA